MKDDSIPNTTVEAGGYRLHVEFYFDAPKHTLRVRYLLNNTSKSAAAIFDRGTTVAVAQNKLKAGSVAELTQEITPDGLVLSHRAAPLRKPAPTVPPVPLAARIAAGAQLGGDVLADTGDAKRVRYCLGVAAFDPAKFSSRQPIDGVELWRASFELAETQRMLCTPWFVLADEAFEKRK
jgi:hypothetical protein